MFNKRCLNFTPLLFTKILSTKSYFSYWKSLLKNFLGMTSLLILSLFNKTKKKVTEIHQATFFGFQF